MDALDAHYPQSCPFCKISLAYPCEPSSPIPSSPNPELVTPQCHLILSTENVLAFLDIMPMAPGHILLTTREHYAKLTDLYNIRKVVPTKHTQSQSEASTHQSKRTALNTSRELGKWLPRLSSALCTVTGIEDWNIVQNNGARAAQVVPHVHFHLIPRYPLERSQSSAAQEVGSERGRRVEKPMGLARSWKMFGRGTREDLDDEEGAKLAAKLRSVLREQLEQWEGREEEGRINAKI